MKIECPETETTMELSECDCGPKCEHYYDTKQHRIDELESAMQEYIDGVDDIRPQSASQLEKWLVRTAEKFKEILK